MSEGPTDYEIREAYLRVCTDMRFNVDAVKAAKLVAMVFKIHPLMVWLAVGGTENMDRIAKGLHQALHIDMREDTP